MLQILKSNFLRPNALLVFLIPKLDGIENQ